MEKDEIITLLKLVATTIQTDHGSTSECREAMFNCLEEIDRAHIKLTGQPLVKRTNGINVIELLVGAKRMHVPIKRPQ